MSVEGKNIVKLLGIIVIIGFIIFKVCDYNSDGSKFARSVSKELKLYYTSMLPFYENLYDCEPYITNVNETNYQVVGLKDDVCHVKFGGYNCQIPDYAARQYASKQTTYLEDNLKALKRKKKDLSIDSSDIDDLTSEIYQDYCKLKWGDAELIIRNHQFGGTKCTVQLYANGGELAGYSCEGINSSQAIEQIKKMYHSKERSRFSF